MKDFRAFLREAFWTSRIDKSITLLFAYCLIEFVAITVITRWSR